jgi:hypothetical protein
MDKYFATRSDHVLTIQMSQVVDSSISHHVEDHRRSFRFFLKGVWKYRTTGRLSGSFVAVSPGYGAVFIPAVALWFEIIGSRF